jgi:hypothetical protein
VWNRGPCEPHAAHEINVQEAAPLGIARIPVGQAPPASDIADKDLKAPPDPDDFLEAHMDILFALQVTNDRKAAAGAAVSFYLGGGIVDISPLSPCHHHPGPFTGKSQRHRAPDSATGPRD